MFPAFCNVPYHCFIKECDVAVNRHEIFACRISLTKLLLQYFKADASGLVRIPLPNGNVLTVPVGAYDKSMSGNMSQDFSSTVQQTGLWKKISVANALGDYGPKNGDPTGAR